MANANMEEGLDKEGKEVLDELEKEGFEIAGRQKAEPEPEAEKPEVKSPDETKGEDKNKDESAEKSDKPEQKEEDKKSEPKEGEDPDKKSKEQKQPDRKIQHVPLAKYLDAETKLKEANEKIAELSKGGKPTEETIADATAAVKTLTEQFGYDEDEAKKLVDVFKHLIPGQKMPPEMQKVLEALPMLDKMKSELEQKQEEIAFQEDFTKNILKEFPQLAEYKDQIKEMAYSDEYAKTPLRAVALTFMHTEGISLKNSDVRTSEKSGGGTNKGAETIDFDNITDEQFSKLTPEQQDKFFEYQEKKERKNRGALN